MQEEPLTERGQIYVGTVITAGLVAVLHSLYSLHQAPVSFYWTLLAGLTLLSGSFTVRIPAIPARLSVSETFVFAAVLLFGPAAATMIVVLDSLVISLWLKQRSRRASRVLFNMSAPSVAIWLAAHAFYALANVEPLADNPQSVLPLLVPLLALAVLYFLLNSVLVAWAVAFEKRISALTIWRENFLWLSLNYFSGASVAALLLPYLQPDKPEFARVVGILLPLLLISYLTFKTAMGRVDDANKHLKELNRLYLSTIETLAMAIDAKDQITHGHIRRVQIHAVALAKAMGVKEDAQIRAIEAAALLHDMGKLAVPEYILNKPGPLTPAEFEKMKLHASAGADILSAIDFPYPVVPIVRHHHENWDGSGYPNRLSGAAIPIGARILSVVDCFDALTSDRPYRPRLPDSDALRILGERRGQMYDPLVIDTFMELHAQGGFRVSGSILEPVFSTLGNSLVPTSSLNQAQRLEDITASGEEMLGLFDLSKDLFNCATSADLGNVIVKHLRRLTPFSLFAIYAYDVSSDELLSVYGFGEQSGIVEGLRIPLGQRLTGWVGAHKQTIRNSDPVLDLGEAARSVSPRLRSCLSAPLLVDDALVGVLSLYSSSRDAFSADHQRILEVITRQVAPVLQRCISPDPARHEPGGDSEVLGLDDLLSLSQGPLAAGESISIISIQLDGLDHIRTLYGPDVEASVIAHVVNCARRHVTLSDIVCRHRPDQVVVIQFRTDKALATAMAIRIRQAIETEDADIRIRGRYRVRMGIASLPEDGDSIDALVVAANRKSALPYLHTNGPGDSPESIH